MIDDAVNQVHSGSGSKRRAKDSMIAISCSDLAIHQLKMRRFFYAFLHHCDVPNKNCVAITARCGI